MMTRYESIFLLAAMATASFFYQRQRGFAARLLLIGVAPVALFGLLAQTRGWFFLPNSVLLKGRPPDGLGALVYRLIGEPIGRLIENPHLFAILILLLVALELRERLTPRVRRMVAVVLATTVLHLILASVGWFYRYEAYLLALAVLVFAEVARDLGVAAIPLRRLLAPPLNLPRLGLITVLMLPLGWRVQSALRSTVRATQNIHEQQGQMARFFQKHYAGQLVAANDIGIIAYSSGATVLDLWGLADIEVLRAKRDKRYGPGFLEQIARERGARVAAIYDDWFKPLGGLPRSWKRIAHWTIHDNVVCGRDTVAFYATDPAEATRLERLLRQFGPELPSGVSVEYASSY
jgi:hypothetical protein